VLEYFQHLFYCLNNSYSSLSIINNLRLKYFIIYLLILIGCSSPSKKSELDDSSAKIVSQQLSIDYASAFDVEYSRGYKIVTIKKPWQGSTDPIIYLLRHKETLTDPEIEKLGKTIIIPIEKIVCNSTSQIVLLEKLELLDRLKGFPQTQYIYSSDILARVKDGNILEVGVEAKLNIESILGLDPDAMMAFNTGKENRQLSRLEELGIPIIINADYMETSAMGKAEWLKFVSAFFDKEELANAYFDNLVTRYESLKAKVNGLLPISVFSGTLYGGTWYMPGGQNYGALLFSESGGDYLWSDDPNVGWLNIPFESVYEKAHSADVWIGASNFKNLAELADADSRYADFRAYKNKRVYAYTNRVNSVGANDYFESGTINPDLILADHIKILHPELLPDYELYYYKRLE
jgi:iron complex transport system substrate-binding protein